MTAFMNLARLTTLTLALFVAGCAGTNLIGVNTDLTRLAEQRQKLDLTIRTKTGAERDAAAAQFAQVDGDLERLTDASYKAAQSALDLKEKLSYYRIAATAGWQRGDARTLQISQEGSTLCNQNKGFDVSPRDCVMLLVIPDLAVNDTWARKMAAVKADAEANQPGLAGKYGVAVFDLLDSYEGLTRAAAQSGTTRAPAQLVGVIDSRQKAIARNINELLTFLAVSGFGPDHTTQVKAMCDALRTRAAKIVPAECSRY